MRCCLRAMVLDLTETVFQQEEFGRGPGRKMLGKIVSSSILTFEEENEKIFICL